MQAMLPWPAMPSAAACGRRGVADAGVKPEGPLDLDYVPNEARKKVVNVALSDNLGFGGHNASIVFKKYVD